MLIKVIASTVTYCPRRVPRLPDPLWRPTAQSPSEWHVISDQGRW